MVLPAMRSIVRRRRFAPPHHEERNQSFLNTIDAIQPVISAMKAVISP